MIPVASKMTEVDNLVGDEVEFSISDARWVMRSMADLYSNRELAVVREYSTNARDAMDEAGKQDQPIIVTLPSLMNPYFKVQDFGVGMSEHDLKYVYTAFGDSTKRQSNDFNGMLGFGCKSAVAYTNTFTVTSIKDGKKTIAVVSRKEDYSIVLKVIVPSVPTNEPNGTTIEVPVHNHAEFEVKARDFYRFWKPGTVTINNKEPVWAVGEKIADGLYRALDSNGVRARGIGTNGYDESYVVMGNVAYRVNNPRVLFTKVNPMHFVAYVDNGAVEFTPSREDLKYSEHTKNTLHKVIADFEDKVVERAADEIKDSPNHAEAYKAWMKWRDILGHRTLGDLVYKGDALVQNIIIDPVSRQAWEKERQSKGLYIPEPTTGVRYRPDYGSSNVTTISVSDMLVGILVVNHPSLSVSSSQKKKVKDWAALKSLPSNYFYFVDSTSVDSPWIPAERVVEWEQVKKDVPTPKRASVGNSVNWGRKAGTFDLVSKSQARIHEQDVPNTKNLYFIKNRDYTDKGPYQIMQLLDKFSVDEQVVIVPGNRLDKFLRNYSAKNILDVLEATIKFDGPSLVPDEIQEINSFTYGEWNALISHSSAVHKIEDPELVRRINMVKSNPARGRYGDEYVKHQTLASVIGKSHKFKPWESHTNKYGREQSYLLTKYPLVRDNTTNIDHSVFYINALYKARKEGKNV